jgi:hypothetical protein
MGPLNLGVLNEWLRAGHGYDGSSGLCSDIGDGDIQRRPSGRDGVWRRLPVRRLRSIGQHFPA